MDPLTSRKADITADNIAEEKRSINQVKKLYEARWSQCQKIANDVLAIEPQIKFSWGYLTGSSLERVAWKKSFDGKRKELKERFKNVETNYYETLVELDSGGADLSKLHKKIQEHVKVLINIQTEISSFYNRGLNALNS